MKKNISGQHTAGPWKIILAPLQVVTDNKIIADLNPVLIDGGYSEELANARLIASAPELLQGLREAIGNIIDTVNYEKEQSTRDFVSRLESIINKAEGK